MLKVSIFLNSWWYKADKMEHESNPPLNKTPTGTSLTIRSFTDSKKVSSNHFFGLSILT